MVFVCYWMLAPWLLLMLGGCWMGIAHFQWILHGCCEFLILLLFILGILRVRISIR